MKCYSTIIAAVIAINGAVITNTNAATNGLSDASAAGSLAVGSVVLLPLSLVVAGSHALGASFEKVSQALSNEPRWNVTHLQPEGDLTRMTLQSPNGVTTLQVAVPTAQIQKANVRVYRVVDARALGKHSYVLECDQIPIGVITDKKVGMAHSKKIK
jgi:hypothetical protein